MIGTQRSIGPPDRDHNREQDDPRARTSLACRHSIAGVDARFASLSRTINEPLAEAETIRTTFSGVRGCCVVVFSPRQTSSRIYRVGVINPGDPLSDTSYFGSAIIRGFAKQGYAVGRNLLLDRRGAQGHKDRMLVLVDELVAMRGRIMHRCGNSQGYQNNSRF
jgi:hypothetical protein